HRQSQGYLRLINIFCENAFIHGYARQSLTIPPHMIAEIAADFRLNVLHPSSEHQKGENAEIARAARTLLELYERLQSNQRKTREMKMTLGAGARTNEPHI